MRVAARQILRLAGALLVVLPLVGCGGGGGGSGSGSGANSGSVNVSLADAAGSDFSHVWVTLTEIRFHTSDAAGENQAGWLKYPLAAPVTIDLAQLNNGALNNVFSGISLPAGTYQQIRLFLAPTEGALTASAKATATASGPMQFNNEVEFGSPAADAPLRIPSAVTGIRLPGNFVVTTGGTLRLAIDVDLDHGLVEYMRGSSPEFLLKPVLSYFDLDHAGAISGQISLASGSNFVIKAESLSADGTRYVLRRATTVRSDGSFILYPLPVPVGVGSATYDVVIRGDGVQTYIIKGVPVTQGTTPSNPTPVQTATITLTADNDFTTDFGSGGGMTPTGAWVELYQTLTATGATEVPYLIRVRHVNPYTGLFLNPLTLSSSTTVNYGGYNGGSAIGFTSSVPAEGQSSFHAFGTALGFARADMGTIAPTTPTLPATSLSIAAPAVADTISGTIYVPNSFSVNVGYLVVTRDGMVVNTVPVDMSTPAASYNFTVSNLPGGSSSVTIPGAWYGLHLYAWNQSTPYLPADHGVAVSGPVDLRSGSATVDLTLQ